VYIRSALGQASSRSKRGPEVEVSAEVSFVQVDVAHDHEVGRVPEDPPETFYFAAIAEVLGGEGVPELVGVDLDAEPLAARKAVPPVPPASPPLPHERRTAG